MAKSFHNSELISFFHFDFFHNKKKQLLIYFLQRLIFFAFFTFFLVILVFVLVQTVIKQDKGKFAYAWSKESSDILRKPQNFEKKIDVTKYIMSNILGYCFSNFEAFLAYLNFNEKLDPLWKANGALYAAPKSSLSSNNNGNF